jgi:hypothetical protein
MSDPKVRARFAVRKIHIEHIGLGDSFERIGQFSRAMHRAKPFAALSAYLICFIKTSHLFPRHPQPGGRPRAFCAGFSGFCEPLFNRRCSFGRHSGRFEIRCGHEKVLREDLRIRLEGHDAAVEFFQFAMDGIEQAFAAKRNFRANRIPPRGSLASKVKRVGQKRCDPCGFNARVDAFGRRSFELRPPIAAARKDFHSRVSRFVGDMRQFLRSAPSLRTRMVAEREMEFRSLSFVCSLAFGYDERLSSIE